MRFFFYSSQGDCISTAERIQREGNEVAVYLQKQPPGSTIGQGIVPMVDNIALKPDTVIVFDYVGNGALADSFRKEGWPVFGASDFQDRIELDRRQGQALMRMAGIETPLTKPFSDFASARQFVKQHSDFTVFKPNGEVSKAMTKVFEDSSGLVKYFEWLEKHWTQEIDFILQERVNGVEVSVEGWFNGESWVHHSFSSTVEEKRLMNDGLGPHTGCAGNVLWFYKHARPEIAKRTLLKLTRFLKQKSYRGPLDINTKGGKGLEFTARLGYDAWQTQMGLLQQETGRLISDTARGQIRQMHTSYDFGVGVRLSIPPYPLENAPAELARIKGRPIEIHPSVRADFHPFDMSVTSEGLGCAGTDGWIGVMTHQSPTLTGLSRVYEKIKKVEVDELQYRTDILTYRALREIPQILAAVSLESDVTLESAMKDKTREYPSKRPVEIKKPAVEINGDEPKPPISAAVTSGIESATKEMWGREIEVS